MIRRLAFPGPSINRSCCHGTRTTRTSPRPCTDDGPRRRRPDVPADRRTVSDLSEHHRERRARDPAPRGQARAVDAPTRSEEHTSELQSRLHLVCRLLLEKKKKENNRVRYGEEE